MQCALLKVTIVPIVRYKIQNSTKKTFSIHQMKGIYVMCQAVVKVADLDLKSN